MIGSSGSTDSWWSRFLPEEGVYAAQYYQEIRDTDPVIGGFFLALESMFRRVEWRSEPADDTPEARRWADFLEGCRADMSHTWPGFIAQVLTMLVHGWSYFEVVYKLRQGPGQPDARRRSRFTDGLIGWRKFAFRPQRTLARWEYDGDGGIQGLWQRAPNGPVFIPIQRALHFRTSEGDGHPEGRSLLVNARRGYRFQKRLEEFEAIGVERNLAGIPHVQVPVELLSPDASAAEKATLQFMCDMAAQLRADERAYVVSPAEEYVTESRDEDGNVKYTRLPTGYKFATLQGSGKTSTDTDPIIRRWGQRMAASVLASFLLLGGDAGGGSQALSSDLTELFEVAGTGILDGITEVVNRFGVAPLMQLNGVPPELWPTLAHGGLSDTAVQAALARIKSALDSGAVTADPALEDHTRKLIGVPDRADAQAEPPPDANPTGAG